MTVLGANSCAILAPFLANGETTQKQQLIFLKYYKARIQGYQKLKIYLPEKVFPKQVCTDTPLIALNAYNDVNVSFFNSFKQYWQRTMFCDDILHIVKSITATIPRTHLDSDICSEDLSSLMRRVRYPYIVQIRFTIF